MHTVQKCAALASKDFSDSTQCSGIVRSVTLGLGENQTSRVSDSVLTI